MKGNRLPASRLPQQRVNPGVFHSLVTDQDNSVNMLPLEVFSGSFHLEAPLELTMIQSMIGLPSSMEQ